MENNVPQQFNLQQRRTFISNTLKATGAVALMQSPLLSNAFYKPPAVYTVQDIINLLIKDIPGAPFKDTVDTIKSGNAGNKVNGIITTMFATVKVIEEAVKLKADFIIAHEPTFYNHTDDVNWTGDNAVVKQKQALLAKHNITVWRFHDYWHSTQPDGIDYGVMKAMGWLPYFKAKEATVTLPALTLKELAAQLKTRLGIEKLRVIGDLSQSCSRIAVMPGAAGGQAQMRVMESEKPDVAIVGEVHEWETAEYIRDARQLGSHTALIVLGHSASEEPGMEYLAEILPAKIPGMPVKHIASGSPFIWV